MERLRAFQNATALIFAVLAVVISFELKLGELVLLDVPHQNALMAALLSALSGSITRWTSGQLLQSASVRRTILGKKHIEGHWLIVTTPHGPQDASLMLLPGILEIKFDIGSGEYAVETVRFSEGGSFTTKSEVAFARTTGVNLRYLNFFKVPQQNQKERRGFSFGDFVYEGCRYPQAIEAYISLEDEKVFRSQRATRIADKKVKQFKRRFGEDEWKMAYIGSRGMMHESVPCNGREKYLIELINNPRTTESAKKKHKRELSARMSEAKRESPSSKVYARMLSYGSKVSRG